MGLSLALLVFVACVVVGTVRYELRRRRRALAARAAFLAAALDDPRFDPDRIESLVRGQLEAVDEALAEGRGGPLQNLFGADALSLSTRSRARAESLDRVSVKRSRAWRVEPVAISNAHGNAPRVVVLAETRIALWRKGLGGFWPALFLTILGAPFRPAKRLAASRRRLAFLVLRPSGTSWELESVEHGIAGIHHLDGPLLADPSEDPALRVRAVRELAAGQPEAEPPISAEGTARPDAWNALHDLALADDRFDPQLVKGVLLEIVAALARDPRAGDPRLAVLSSAEARAQLQTMSALGSPRLDRWRPLLFVESDPPELVVEVVVVAGRRRFRVSPARWELGLRPVREHTATWKLRFVPDTEEHWVLMSAFARRERPDQDSPRTRGIMPAQ